LKSIFEIDGKREDKLMWLDESKAKLAGLEGEKTGNEIVKNLKMV